jgi:hypothetical protein
MAKHLTFFIRQRVQFIISLLAKFLHQKVFYSTLFIFLFSFEMARFHEEYMYTHKTKQNLVQVRVKFPCKKHLHTIANLLSC